MDKFFGPDGKAIMFALDDDKYTADTANDDVMDNMVHLGQNHGADVTLGWMKLFERPETLRGQPGVLQMVASTDKPLEKDQIYDQADMERAAAMGAVAVAVHINGTSDFESEQLHTLERVATQAHKVGMAVLSHTYIRTMFTYGQHAEYHYDDFRKSSAGAGDYAAKLHRVAKRASDSGADILKLPYVGNRQKFARLVNDLKPSPVLMAGGDKLAMHGFLKISHQSMYESGASGIAVGRNVFEHSGDKANIAMTALDNITHYQMHYVAAQKLAIAEIRNGDTIPADLIREAKHSYKNWRYRQVDNGSLDEVLSSYRDISSAHRQELDDLAGFDEGDSFDDYQNPLT